MTSFSVRNLSFKYESRNDVRASPFSLRSVDFDYDHAEILCIVGPNGSGKSTFLRLVAGLEQPFAGTITFSDGELSERPHVGLLLQDLGLFDWKTVEGNIEFGLICARTPRREWPERVSTIARQLGLEDHRQKYPNELSGGLRQRCAIGRALAYGAGLLLMDEPFSAIDPVGSAALVSLIQELHATGFGLVIVMHDLETAILLADRIIVFGGDEKTIRGETTVNLPKPRTLNVRFLPAFKQNLLTVEALLPSHEDWVHG
jgi:NitT/TauT family transport system ATP-binding protein